jgi:hypothetical protein
MMETEIAPETSVIFDQLTRMIAREDFINFIHSESFRSCSIFIYVYSLMAYFLFMSSTNVLLCIQHREVILAFIHQPLTLLSVNTRENSNTASSETYIQQGVQLNVTQ